MVTFRPHSPTTRGEQGGKSTCGRPTSEWKQEKANGDEDQKCGHPRNALQESASDRIICMANGLFCALARPLDHSLKGFAKYVARSDPQLVQAFARKIPNRIKVLVWGDQYCCQG